MKINTREFKNIVRSIIKEEMEKVEEDFGTSMDYKIAKGYGDIEKEPSEDIETSEKPKSLMNSVRAFMKYVKMQGFSEKDVKSALDNL